jgi:hypothetical protein
MNEASEMVLVGPQGSLRLKLVRYQFPSIVDDEWDSNWLIVSGAVSVDGKSWRFEDPCLTNFEAARLADWLEKVARGQGGPEIGFVEPNLGFERTTQENIRVTFTLESAPPWATLDDDWDVHGFEAPVGPQLAEAADALRRQLTAFPERGRQNAQ